MLGSFFMSSVMENIEDFHVNGKEVLGTVELACSLVSL